MEIYDEVSSGNEIRSVMQAGERLEKFPMSEIGTHADVEGRRPTCGPSATS